MRAHQAVYPVQAMCRVLEVSRSGYYAWRRREPSARAQSDATLTARIREVHEDSRKTYGSPRIHAELQEEGQRVGRKRVARLMRGARLEGASRRRFVKTTQRAEDARPAPDLVNRDFSVSGPDQLWVADITYVPTWAGFLGELNRSSQRSVSDLIVATRSTLRQEFASRGSSAAGC